MTFVSLFLFGLLSTEYPENYFSFLIILPDLDYRNIFILALKFRKNLIQILFTILCIYIFYLANSPSACILCLMVLQNWCHSVTQNSPQWLPFLLIAISNDVHKNPGPPFQNSFFTFMQWNVNSIAKDNFQRVRLIEAHNCISSRLCKKVLSAT